MYHTFAYHLLTNSICSNDPLTIDNSSDHSLTNDIQKPISPPPPPPSPSVFLELFLHVNNLDPQPAETPPPLILDKFQNKAGYFFWKHP